MAVVKGGKVDADNISNEKWVNESGDTMTGDLGVNTGNVYLNSSETIKSSSTTTGSQTIYVDADNGSDSTGDGSSGSPYETLQTAWDLLPEVLDHSVTFILKEATASYDSVDMKNKFCSSSDVEVLVKGEMSMLDSGDIDSTAENVNDPTYGSDVKVATMTDSSKSWTSDEHQHKLVRAYKSGETDQYKIIKENTSDTLYIVGFWGETNEHNEATIPDSTWSYQILDWATELEEVDVRDFYGTIEFKYLDFMAPTQEEGAYLVDIINVNDATVTACKFTAPGDDYGLRLQKVPVGQVWSCYFKGQDSASFRAALKLVGSRCFSNVGNLFRHWGRALQTGFGTEVNMRGTRIEEVNQYGARVESPSEVYWISSYGTNLIDGDASETVSGQWVEGSGGYSHLQTDALYYNDCDTNMDAQAWTRSGDNYPLDAPIVFSDDAKISRGTANRIDIGTSGSGDDFVVWGKQGIGIAPSYSFHIKDTSDRKYGSFLKKEITDSALTSSSALEVIMKPLATSDNSGEYRALDFSTRTDSANDNNWTGILTGISGTVGHRGSGTVNEARGGHFKTNIIEDGTITNAVGMEVGVDQTDGSTGDITTAKSLYVNNDLVGTGSITNNYGIYIEDQNIATTNNYGIYFAGTGTENAINWAGDTEIGRSAANTVNIPDRLKINWTSTATDSEDRALDVTTTTVNETSGISYAGYFQTDYNPANAPSAGAGVGARGFWGRVQTPVGSSMDFSHATLMGASGAAYHQGNATLGIANGFVGAVKSTGSGTIENAKAVKSFLHVSSGATITNGYHFEVSTPLINGTLTNQYGLYVHDMTDGASNYPIYFAGRGEGGKISWLGDANLYSPSANTLKTDDNLTVGGTILVGDTTPEITGGIVAHGTTGPTTNFASTRVSDNDKPVYFAFGRARGNIGSETVLQDDDQILSIQGQAYDGTEYILSSEILMEMDSSISDGSAPGRIIFSTMSEGEVSPDEAITIDSSQRVGIGTASPDSKLHVEDKLTSDGSSLFSNLEIDTQSGLTVKALRYHAQDLGGTNNTVYGVQGLSQGTGNTGGTYYGVYGAVSVADGTTYGVYGQASGGSTNYAGYFGNGDVHVENNLTVAGDVTFQSIQKYENAFTFTLPADSSSVNISFPTAFGTGVTPVVICTPQFQTSFWVTSVDENGFTFNAGSTNAYDQTIMCIAMEEA